MRLELNSSFKENVKDLEQISSNITTEEKLNLDISGLDNSIGQEIKSLEQQLNATQETGQGLLKKFREEIEKMQLQIQNFQSAQKEINKDQETFKQKTQELSRLNLISKCVKTSFLNWRGIEKVSSELNKAKTKLSNTLKKMEGTEKRLSQDSNDIKITTNQVVNTTDSIVKATNRMAEQTHHIEKVVDLLYNFDITTQKQQKELDQLLKDKD